MGDQGPERVISGDLGSIFTQKKKNLYATRQPVVALRLDSVESAPTDHSRPSWPIPLAPSLTFVIVLGTFVLYAAGIPAVGGLKKVLQVTSSAGRGIGIDFTFDLSKPYTFSSAITGIPLAALSISACGQYNAQRYLVVKTVREARITAVFGQMFSLFFVVFYVFAGQLIYTHFAGCDPLTNGEVSKEDQVFPLWLVEVFQTYPGVIGIMICASFSSSLSTASSGINAQAVMTHKEIKKGLPFMKDVTPERNIQFTKLLTGFLGSIILCVSFLATYIGGILDAVITWAGILTGPILAVFILGMVSRRATSLAAFLGMLSATIIGIWLKIGNTYYPRAPTSLPPLFTDQCNGTTMSMTTTMTSVNDIYDVDLFVNGDYNFEEIPPSVYQISTCLLFIDRLCRDLVGGSCSHCVCSEFSRFIWQSFLARRGKKN
ncbi:putative sodium/iodide cotransporter [Apostichopus japonicus]|uniref:Putative sodium/iodide cotransporter n=1 Tax=Stichopus japonicus TaxID=307972 RepID=A0A2G8JLP2_STIJA|nr:putative sodium/iodide cotransporter [Apostichopus japonicus]